MPLKQQYGRPPIPPRKGQILTTKNIIDQVKTDSKKDAAFVRNKMAEFYKTHQLRGDEAKPTIKEKMRLALKKPSTLKIKPPRTPKGRPIPGPRTPKGRPIPGPRTPTGPRPISSYFGGKTRRKRRRKKKKTRKRRKKKTRRRKKKNMRGCSKKRRRR